MGSGLRRAKFVIRFDASEDRPIVNPSLAPFLASSTAIDSDHPSVRRLADEVRRTDALATVQAAYETVRDRYAHSYDIAATEVSVSASDVLENGHGICFAKAHLLAAVLRACDIPAALCYQN